MSPEDHRFGIHYYQDRLGCLRRACTPEGDPGGDDAAFGTALHHFLHLYHSGQLGPGGEQALLSGERPLNKGGKARTCSELELATRYAFRFPPEIWGQMVLAEQRLSGTLAGEPIAGTLDWLGAFGPEDVERLAVLRGLTLPGPGRYLVDFKTKTRKSETMIDGYYRSSQFPLYHLLADQAGLGPLEGTLVVILLRYLEDKDEAFMTLFVPPPSADDLAICTTIVREAALRERTLGAQHVTPTHCFDWNRPCPLLDLGCPRHNEG